MRGDEQAWQEYTVSRRGEPPLVFTAQLVLHQTIPTSQSSPDSYHLVRIWKLETGFRACITRFVLWKPNEITHEVFDGDSLEQIMRAILKRVPRCVFIAIEGALRGEVTHER